MIGALFLGGKNCAQRAQNPTLGIIETWPFAVKGEMGYEGGDAQEFLEYFVQFVNGQQSQTYSRISQSAEASVVLKLGSLHSTPLEPGLHSALSNMEVFEWKLRRI